METKMETKKIVYIIGNDVTDNKYKFILTKFGFKVIMEFRQGNFLSIFEKREITNNILKNVKLADIVILSHFYNEPGQDSMIAVGSALALGKEVWTVGDKRVDSTLYYNTNVANFSSWFELYSELHPL